jgi:hypothetical protein
MPYPTYPKKKNNKEFYFLDKKMPEDDFRFLAFCGFRIGVCG